MSLFLALLPLLSLWRLSLASQSEFEIREDVRSGEIVANLAHEFSLDLKARPYLQITNRRSNAGAQCFAINRTTGVLYVLSPPDRDALCQFQVECRVDLMVAHGNRRNPSINVVRVKIIDVNDNAPVFPKSSMVIKVPEETDPFRLKLDLMVANDKDYGENGVQSYKLEGDSEQLAPFRLEVRNDGPKLFLQIKLDRERRDSYRFRLVAVDGGRPRLSGTLSVNILVLDTNDQAPQFERAAYETNVAESILKGTEILRVKAVDKDVGANGELVYDMASPNTLQEQMASRYFAVHTIEGEGRVVVKSELDVDQKHLRHFQFYVIASDKGSTPQTAKVRVTVRVTDVNDFQPVIDINYLNEESEERSRGFVPEGNKPTTVAMVAVTDLDSGPGGQVECRVGNDGFYLEDFLHIASQGSRHESESSKRKQFKLMSRGSFDREMAPLLTFPIICVDNGGGDGALTGSTMVDIRVLDRNDETPTFVRTLFIFGLAENQPKKPSRGDLKPMQIGRVTAVDKDEGDNAKITYSIEAASSEHSRAFRIDPATGAIFAVASFDREVVDHVMFKVKATDRGKPKKLSSTAFVRVEIRDENDCAPQFSQSHYHFEVVENSPSLVVGQVKATDLDAKAFAAIRYRLYRPRGSTDSRFFSINPLTGLLQVNQKLDRERKEQYVLTVLAVDNPERQSGRKNTGTATVTVNVLDENDCAPHISYPKNNEEIQLNGDATIGQLLFTMKATDDDNGENATVSYSIVSGARGFFAIHPDTGTFYVANKVQRSPQSTFVVHLRASDQGTPRPLNSSVTVRIRTNRRSDSSRTPYDPENHEALPVGADQRSIIVILSTIFVLLLITTGVLAWLIKRRRDTERRRYYHQQPPKFDPNEAAKEASEVNLTLLHTAGGPGGANTLAKCPKFDMEIGQTGQRDPRAKSLDGDETSAHTATLCRGKRSSEGADYYQALAGTYDTRGGKDPGDKGMHLYYEIHGAADQGGPFGTKKGGGGGPGSDVDSPLKGSKDYDWNVQTKLPLSAKNTPAASRRANHQYSPYVEASFV